MPIQTIDLTDDPPSQAIPNGNHSTNASTSRNPLRVSQPRNTNGSGNPSTTTHATRRASNQMSGNIIVIDSDDADSDPDGSVIIISERPPIPRDEEVIVETVGGEVIPRGRRITPRPPPERLRTRSINPPNPANSRDSLSYFTYMPYLNPEFGFNHALHPIISLSNFLGRRYMGDNLAGLNYRGNDDDYYPPEEDDLAGIIPPWDPKPKGKKWSIRQSHPHSSKGFSRGIVELEKSQSVMQKETPPKRRKSASKSGTVIEVNNQVNIPGCASCRDPLLSEERGPKQPWVLFCGHAVCGKCITEARKRSDLQTSPAKSTRSKSSSKGVVEDWIGCPMSSCIAASEPLPPADSFKAPFALFI